MEKYYKILEIHTNATEQEVKQAYRDMVKVWHPDRFTHDIKLQKRAEENLKKINDAYQRIVDHLNNSHKRQQSQQYERTEKQEKPDSQPPPQRPHYSWICPDCLRTNDSYNLSCGCGFRTNEVEITTYKTDQSSAALYDVILFNRRINHKDRAKFLARYLLKRFPNSKEADFIKKGSQSATPPRQTKPNKLRHLKKNWGWYLFLGLVLLAITMEMARDALKYRVKNPFDIAEQDYLTNQPATAVIPEKEVIPKSQYVFEDEIKPKQPKDLFQKYNIPVAKEVLNKPQAVASPSIPQGDIALKDPSPYELDYPVESKLMKPKEPGNYQSLPVNGAVKMYVTDEAIAPLKIVTRERGYHYFVKIVDWYTNGLICTVFIRSGQSVSLDLPFGSYKLKYAAGSQWYGTKFLFGPETAYSVADKRFDFEARGDNVSGYTVELFLQPHGNLRTNRIAAEEF